MKSTYTVKIIGGIDGPSQMHMFGVNDIVSKGFNASQGAQAQILQKQNVAFSLSNELSKDSVIQQSSIVAQYLCVIDRDLCISALTVFIDQAAPQCRPFSWAIHRQKRHFILIWTTEVVKFESWRLKVLEALFSQHPYAVIHIFTNHLTIDMFKEFVDAGFKIVIEPIDYPALIQATPIQLWYNNVTIWEKGPSFYSHITDALRVILLWKHGGTYIDFDVIMLKSFRALQNSIGHESYFINAAISTFDKGHPYLSWVMTEFADHYIIDIWTCVGPILITDIAGKYRRQYPNAVHVSENPPVRNLPQKTSVHLNIYNASTFYPIPWWNATAPRYINASQLDYKELREVNANAYTYHIWTKMFTIEKVSGFSPWSFLDVLIKYNSLWDHKGRLYKDRRDVGLWFPNGIAPLQDFTILVWVQTCSVNFQKEFTALIESVGSQYPLLRVIALSEADLTVPQNMVGVVDVYVEKESMSFGKALSTLVNLSSTNYFLYVEQSMTFGSKQDVDLENLVSVVQMRRDISMLSIPVRKFSDALSCHSFVKTGESLSLCAYAHAPTQLNRYVKCDYVSAAFLARTGAFKDPSPDLKSIGDLYYHQWMNGGDVFADVKSFINQSNQTCCGECQKSLQRYQNLMKDSC
ncbi:hypothetical protein MP228_009793 [Amoeboaphelidium protococcarum]|nr:hypothetical protein MP228_009793 [Amoeboaphelidium protococcarum]